MAPRTPGSAPDEPREPIHSTLADDDSPRPTYGKAELERALIADRGAEASDERRLAEFEQKADDAGARNAAADLAVRRHFIAALERCQAIGVRCPPRLDDPAWSYDVESDAPPKLDAQLRFDLADWRVIAAELAGRACACRKASCVESFEVVIDRLEQRPMEDVRGDEVASASITYARECLFELRGHRVHARQSEAE